VTCSELEVNREVDEIDLMQGAYRLLGIGGRWSFDATVKIRLMADFDCFPLWEVRADGTRNVDPSELPISESLMVALRSWGQQYDRTLNRRDPASSGFQTKEEESTFEAEGKRLSK